MNDSDQTFLKCWSGCIIRSATALNDISVPTAFQNLDIRKEVVDSMVSLQILLHTKMHPLEVIEKHTASAKLEDPTDMSPITGLSLFPGGRQILRDATDFVSGQKSLQQKSETSCSLITEAAF